MFQLRVETKRSRLACAVKAVSFVFTCYKYALYTFSLSKRDLSLVLRKNRLFAYAKKKTQISFAVTAKLISAFVFATRIVQSLFYLNTKFQASSHLLWLYSLVCVRPGQKPRRPVFSERGSFNVLTSVFI